MFRVSSFAMAFNYNILNYLRLNYIRLAYLTLKYAQFLLFLVLGCITSSDDIQPSKVVADQ